MPQSRPTLPGPHILYGGDYNPEQWSEDIWLQDVQLMQDAGVNFVSVGIFGWNKLEPEEGRFEFAWLDQVLDLLHAHQIQVNLATATASPPAWMAHDYPETLPVNPQGAVFGFGSRQQYSPASPIYREKAARLVRKLAKRYGQHPAVKMWHINNEYGCHIQECFSETTAQAFRAWLKHRYGSLHTLNQVWGTSFWSQTYHKWEHIQPPRMMPAFPNPTQLLDWRRFSSDMIQQCMQLEVDILREVTPHLPVNTNFLGFSRHVNQRALAQIEDIVSIDLYPDPASPDAAQDTALQADWARSLKDGQGWIVMEQAPGQVQWRPVNQPKLSGQMRLLSYSMIARGASGVMFFQWRQSQAGAEKYHSGMLPHTGTTSRIWQEIRQLGQELKNLPPLKPTLKARVALVIDWDSWQALEQDSHPHNGLRLMDQVYAYHQALWKENIITDIVTSYHDLSPYPLVITPSLPLLSETSAANLRQYVKEGGHLVMGYFSGITDQNDHVHPTTRHGSYNPLLCDVLGIQIREFSGHDPRATLLLDNGFQASQWSEDIELQGASALAHFTHALYEGGPAVTRNNHGLGQAYHLATQLDPESMQQFIKQVLHTARIKAPLEVPEGVEVVRWEDGTLFVLNHTPTPQTVTLPTPHQDLLNGTTHTQHLHLQTRGVALLQPQIVTVTP